MAFTDSEQPWSIRRDGSECARACTRRDADRIIQQLQKLYPAARLAAHYEGKNISHCGNGGRPLS
ncbi:MAG: hypothetical protein Kow00121_38950 [Elainellaceae cyanobacterium]